MDYSKFSIFGFLRKLWNAYSKIQLLDAPNDENNRAIIFMGNVERVMFRILRMINEIK